MPSDASCQPVWQHPTQFNLNAHDLLIAFQLYGQSSMTMVCNNCMKISCMNFVARNYGISYKHEKRKGNAKELWWCKSSKILTRPWKVSEHWVRKKIYSHPTSHWHTDTRTHARTHQTRLIILGCHLAIPDNFTLWPDRNALLVPSSWSDAGVAAHENAVLVHALKSKVHAGRSSA